MVAIMEMVGMVENKVMDLFPDIDFVPYVTPRTPTEVGAC